MTTPTDDELFARFPHAAIDHDTKGFYRGLLQRRLLLNRCTACGHWHHPPLPMCPRCWSTDLVPTPVAGRGTVYLMTVMHQGPAACGVDYEAGYPVGAVELDEQPGLRFTAGIRAGAAPVGIGCRVRLCWGDRDGAPLVLFEPDECEAVR